MKIQIHPKRDLTLVSLDGCPQRVPISISPLLVVLNFFVWANSRGGSDVLVGGYIYIYICTHLCVFWGSVVTLYPFRSVQCEPQIHLLQVLIATHPKR